LPKSAMRSLPRKAHSVVDEATHSPCAPRMEPAARARPDAERLAVFRPRASQLHHGRQGLWAMELGDSFSGSARTTRPTTRREASSMTGPDRLRAVGPWKESLTERGETKAGRGSSSRLLTKRPAASGGEKPRSVNDVQISGREATPGGNEPSAMPPDRVPAALEDPDASQHSDPIFSLVAGPCDSRPPALPRESSPGGRLSERPVNRKEMHEETHTALVLDLSRRQLGVVEA
jgi:hypothetical protein